MLVPVRYRRWPKTAMGRQFEMPAIKGPLAFASYSLAQPSSLAFVSWRLDREKLDPSLRPAACSSSLVRFLYHDFVV
jgi:hypothetical protein